MEERKKLIAKHKLGCTLSPIDSNLSQFILPKVIKYKMGGYE